MTIPLTVNMWHKMTQLEALLDCGATHNFIDPCTIRTFVHGNQSIETNAHCAQCQWNN